LPYLNWFCLNRQKVLLNFPIFMATDLTMPKKKGPKLLAGYTLHNKVRLVHGGTDYFSTLVHLIDQAKTLIHLQTYIFDG